MDDSGRLIVYALWAFGCVVVWGRVFLNTSREYRSLPHHERRITTPIETRIETVRAKAFREVVSDFALMLVGLFAAISLLTLIFGQEIPGLRGFALALALGAFLGAGIVRLK